MGHTMSYTETLTVCHCWCGIALAIPDNLYRVAHEDKHDVYCPLGHVFTWTETATEKLRKKEEELRRAHQREQATRSLLHAEERSHSATRGHLTRHRKRAAAGVCPCCNRTFQNVGRHMKTKHPDYVEEHLAASA